VPNAAHHAAAAHRSGSGCHRRSAAWPPTRPFLQRLLRSLLLHAAVYLLRRSSALRVAAAERCRRRGGEPAARGKDRGPHSAGVAAGRVCAARRQRFLPRVSDALVRSARRALPVRTREKQPFAEDTGPGDARGEGAARADQTGVARIQRLHLSDEEKLGPGTSRGELTRFGSLLRFSWAGPVDAKIVKRVT